MAPSTFASAAAGSNQHNQAQSTRDSGSEWYVERADGRRGAHCHAPPIPEAAEAHCACGETQADSMMHRARRTNGTGVTFSRRVSGAAAVSSSSPQTDGAAPSQSQPPPRYVPPHRNGTLSDTMRYSKDELLDVGKQLRSIDAGLADELSDLYAGNWRPEMANGTSSAAWGRGDHNRDAQAGPDVCWEKNGLVEPLGLVPMDDEEKEVRIIWISNWICGVATILMRCAALLNICQRSAETGRNCKRCCPSQWTSDSQDLPFWHCQRSWWRSNPIFICRERSWPASGN
jgi:hypothetical protein